MRIEKGKRRKGGHKDFKAFYGIIPIAVNAGKLMLIHFRLNSSYSPHGCSSLLCMGENHTNVFSLEPGSADYGL